MTDIGDVSVECVVTDITGNGFLDELDRFDLFARNGTTFHEGMAMGFRVFYSVTDTDIIYESIDFFEEPASHSLVSTGDGHVTIILAPIHNGTDIHYELVDVIWDNIVVRLTDG